MRFKEAIELMQEEDSEETVIVAYWKRDSIERDLEEKITDQEWDDLCEHGNYNMDWSCIAESLCDTLEHIRSQEETS